MSKTPADQQALYTTAANRILPGVAALFFGLILMITSNGDYLIILLGAFLLGLGGLFVWNGINFISGAIGKKKADEELFVFPEGWLLLKDLLIPQALIDYVLVCPKGIFIIERENYSGRIAGDGESAYWQQISGRNTVDFLNPTERAAEHMAQAGRFLQESDIRQRANGIVVFTSHNARLRVSNTVIPVLRLEDLQAYLNLLPEALDTTEIADIAAVLTDCQAKEVTNLDEKITSESFSGQWR